MTLRATFATQSAPSQKADAFPADVMRAAISSPARSGMAMRYLNFYPLGSGSASALHDKPRFSTTRRSTQLMHGSDAQSTTRRTATAPLYR